jgi:hypothetical protein
MKEKQPDLAAGRLGLSPPQGDSRGRPLTKKSTYGVKRLGISGVEQAKAGPPQALTALSQAVAARSAPGAQTTEPAPTVPAPATAPASRGYELDLAPFTITVTHFSKRLVYAGTVAAALVIGVTCFVLWHGSGAPQSAEASLSPSPPPAMSAARPAEDANRLPAAVAKATPLPAATPTTQPQRAAGLSQLVMDLARSASSQFKERPAEPLARSWAPSPTGPAASPAPAVAAVAVAPASPAPAANEGPAAAPAAATEPVGYKVAPDGIVISGIFRGPSGPIAVINNQFLKVGQSFDQYKVTKIDEYAVELEEAGQRFLVSLSSAPARAAPEKDASAEDDPPPPPKPAPKAAKVQPPDATAAPSATSRPVRTRGSKPPVPPTFN